jgi:hypothetical protein
VDTGLRGKVALVSEASRGRIVDAVGIAGVQPFPHMGAGVGNITGTVIAIDGRTIRTA